MNLMPEKPPELSFNLTIKRANGTVETHQMVGHIINEQQPATEKEPEHGCNTLDRSA